MTENSFEVALPNKAERAGEMRRKLVMLVLTMSGIASAAAYTVNDLADVGFAKYRVLSQGPGLAGDGHATYMISVNPPLGIYVESADPLLLKRIATGVLHNCLRFGDAQNKTFEKAALVLNQRYAEIDMAQAVTGVALEQGLNVKVQGAKNFIAYVNETVGLPRFQCEGGEDMVKSFNRSEGKR